MPLATTTSCGRPESSFCQFLALGNTAQLRTLGIDVCARTVARLLKAMGFSLRVNHKKLAGASHPNRNDQFELITALRERCAAENTPVISVDTKKKELVGAFKNAGAKWTPHHFASCIFASSSVRGRLLRSIDPGM